ncbi:MAG: molybdopterin dinucleotide binding domain-containing protein [Coriobacteriia bacterium]|nr:molybdopterin dinucleotide binding domain-containing protein [Coriobacteriia bacterium]
MTNNWVDLGFSTCFIVQGANPVENHPASIAHLNSARFDTNGRGRNAALVVIDPRQTRTARMIKAGYDSTNTNDMRKHDRFVRIRPGTNVAFNNGVLNSIITWMYANPTDQRSINFFAWHNGTADNSLATRAVTADDGLASSVAAWPKYCDTRLKTNATGTDYQRETVTGVNGKAISNFPVRAANIEDAECVFQRLKAHVAKYTAAITADICGCTEADIAAVRDAYIDNSRFASSDFGAAAMTQNAAGYRAACIMYAMGATQFTTGSQGVRGYAQIQTIMGNMGRAGGGINALRGIHNVQGSTDMGVLFDLIPGYSGNPGVGTTYPNYSNALFGNRVVGTTTNSPYVPANLGLQQRGFYNMTTAWFGEQQDAVDTYSSADFEALYACWPKGNGVQHIESFRRMCPTAAENPTAAYHYAPTAAAPRISACVVWGQNPAITEPNQSAVRTGLYNLDLLVVTDMFANETAQCSRKSTGVTYLLPACSHVEESGSVTSSGRWIQWRDRCRAPKDNSKSDLELLLKFAKALDGANAFSHIEARWATMTNKPVGSAYNVLYGKYGWDGTGSMEAISLPDAEGVTLKGSEHVAEQIFKEMCSPLNATTGIQGTLWIYSGNDTASAYNAATGDNNPAVGINWGKANRAKSRAGAYAQAGTSGQYARYGWAWLLNRRIFYNNSELAGDVNDVFVAPGFIARILTINTNTLADWSTLYRAYNTLADMPDVGTSTGMHVYPGRFPAYTEPYESPRPDLVTKWGKNTANGSALIFADSPVGAVADFPLVLTSIRCVEHFQGGPITRNNAWNVDAEPDPWIEINSADAIKYGIADGMWVNVITARGDSIHTQEALTAGGALAPVANWTKGFKARVGVGTLANQRVAPGTVAIPWHWGDRGLGVGARANDLCIDSWDANTMIPEFKACLCKIEKA